MEDQALASESERLQDGEHLRQGLPAQQDRTVEAGRLVEGQPGEEVRHPVAERGVGGSGHEKGGAFQGLHRQLTAGAFRRREHQLVTGPLRLVLVRSALQHLVDELTLFGEDLAFANHRGVAVGRDEFWRSQIADRIGRRPGPVELEHRKALEQLAATVGVPKHVLARSKCRRGGDFLQHLGHPAHLEPLGGIEDQPPRAQPTTRDAVDHFAGAGGHVAKRASERRRVRRLPLRGQRPSERRPSGRVFGFAPEEVPSPRFRSLQPAAKQ